ncbi:hypothetical protein F5Y18DRAFT_133569 [Xylariaceae sp. FL1019]|nr:hypothetical protein F5Y18DRAFT_133569 [Xylariaceae sp. FL1019]
MASPDTPDMKSLRISESPRLDTIPTDILFIIFGYLDTARSVVHLAATCKGMSILVSANAWRIFVLRYFSGLSLPATHSADDWKETARLLTSQSRDWDRRAFIFHSLAPPQMRRGQTRRAPNTQSIPANVIVDAYLRKEGNLDEETVVWGAGEDLLARTRRTQKTAVITETWHTYKGGYVSGKDDTTAISIWRGGHPQDETESAVVVGRANGELRLMSTKDSSFGQTLMQFGPASSPPVVQTEIQSVDLDHEDGVLASATRDSVFLYSLLHKNQIHEDGATESHHATPLHSISLKDSPESTPFEFIRSIKALKKDTYAVAMNRSFDPIQLLNVTPSGLRVTKAAKMTLQYPGIESSLRTVRAVLPIDASSIACGGGNVMLSSWDDGTIRLQDWRTPSPIDRMYQDNFELATPINALISYGLERFVAGSAYSHMLKIFDFRWDKGYHHTDALPCSSQQPYPTPKPPTVVDEPDYADDRTKCNHVLGRFCRWHALSRHDFFRPNCNIYLRFRDNASSPIYSLAKPSDVSPTIYAGVSGFLVEANLKSGISDTHIPNKNSPYLRQKGKVAILETGDGMVIYDVSKCKRVPEIRRQSFGDTEHIDAMARKRHRLDEALQNPHEWLDYL